MDLNQKNQDKKKGGRPQKSFVSLKSRTVGVCFTELEFDSIKHRAKQANLPISVYCHDAVLNGEIKEPIKKEDLEVLRGLSNVGNNLNQLARIAKFLNANRLEKKTQIVLENILKIINQLSDDWKNSKRKKL